MADKTVVVHLAMDTALYKAGGSQAVAVNQTIGTSAKQASTVSTASFASTAKSVAIAGVAVAATGAAVKATVGEYMSFGKEVLKLQRYAGGSAEDMSRLAFAAQQSGLDIDSLGRSLGIASKKLVDSKDPMRQFGVEARDTSGNLRPVKDVLLDFADKINAMPPGFERTAAAQRLFGRSGADLLPFLQRGRDGLQGLMDKADEYGLVISDTGPVKDQIAAQREFEATLRGLEVQVGANLTPIITGLTRAMASVPTPVSAAAVTLGVAGAAAFAVQRTWVALTGVVGNVSAWASAQAATSGTAAALGSMALKSAGAAVAVVGLIEAYNQWTELQKANEANTKGVVEGLNKRIDTKGLDNARDSISRYNEQINKLAQDDRNLAGSLNPLDQAKWAATHGTTDNQIDALKESKKRTEELIERSNELMRTQGLSKKEAWAQAEAEKHVADGKQEDTTATEELTQTEEQLAQARQQATTTYFSLVDGQKHVADSTKAVADAQRNAEQAVRRVGDAQRSYGDAVRRVDDAHRSYEAAVRGVEAAEQRRTDSLRKVEDAQRAVTDAQQKLNEAMQGPSEDDQLSLDRAKLRLDQVKQRISQGNFSDPLDQRAAKLDLRQAEADLKRTQAEVAGRVSEAQTALEQANQSYTAAQRDALAADQAVTDAHRAVSDAARGIADAEHQAADAARAVRDAQREAADAAAQVADKQRDATRAMIDFYLQRQAAADTFSKNPDALGDFITDLEHLKALAPETAAALDPYIQQAKALRAEAEKRKALEEAFATVQHIMGHAAGGPVTANTPYIVGERGEELFVPDTAGTIIPNGMFTSATAHPPGYSQTAPPISVTHTYWGTTGERAAELARRRDSRELTGRQR